MMKVMLFVINQLLKRTDDIVPVSGIRVAVYCLCTVEFVNKRNGYFAFVLFYCLSLRNVLYNCNCHM
jgi:hypothetical protein